MFTRARLALVLAEFVGTGLLVMLALVLTENTAVSYFIATSLAIGLAVIYMLFGGVSGAHVNPAVTFGMWVARRARTIPAASYVAAQLLGGLAAWQLYQYLTDRTLAIKEIPYSTQMLVAEVVGTAILAMAFAAVVSRRYDALSSAIALGAAYFTAIMVAAIASSAYLNPAIALGVRGWSVATAVGPLIGGVIGVVLYLVLFTSNKRA